MSIFEISSIALWVVVLINLILTLAIIRHLSQQSATLVETLPKGSIIPDFQAKSLDGKTVTYEDFSGKSLVLVFVSPSCGHCRPIIGEVESLYASAVKEGFEIAFICDGDLDQTRSFVDEMNITIPILSASRINNSFLKDYKIGGVPTYVIADSDKKVSAAGGLHNLGWENFVNLCKGEEG